jgi:hypothetical protein
MKQSLAEGKVAYIRPKVVGPFPVSVQALSQDKKQGMHSRVATYTVASDHTSLQRWAPAPPRVPQPRTSAPCWGELWRCHVSLSSKLCLPDEVSSGAATCPMAPGSASLRGELRCRHVSHDPRRAVDHRNKERLSCPSHAARLACFQGTLVRYRGACKICMPLQCRSTCRYSVALQCNVGPADHSKTWLQWWYDPTGRYHNADHVQYIRAMRYDDFTLLTLCKTSFATPGQWCPTTLGFTCPEATCRALRLIVTTRPWAIKGSGRCHFTGVGKNKGSGSHGQGQAWAIQLHSPVDVGHYAPAARTT